MNVKISSLSYNSLLNCEYHIPLLFLLVSLTQVCGLYTKNLFYAEYPKGPEVLEESIRGGELFQVGTKEQYVALCTTQGRVVKKCLRARKEPKMIEMASSSGTLEWLN